MNDNRLSNTQMHPQSSSPFNANNPLSGPPPRYFRTATQNSNVRMETPIQNQTHHQQQLQQQQPHQRNINLINHEQSLIQKSGEPIGINPNVRNGNSFIRSDQPRPSINELRINSDVLQNQRIPPEQAPRFPVSPPQMKINTNHSLMSPSSKQDTPQLHPPSVVTNQTLHATTDDRKTLKDAHLNENFDKDPPATPTSTNVSPEIKYQQELNNPKKLINSNSDLKNENSLKFLNKEKDSFNVRPDKPKSEVSDLPVDPHNTISEEKIQLTTHYLNKSETKLEKNLVKNGNSSEITCGLVHKNIKFFEKNDTAKIPLTPATILSTVKRRTERTVSAEVYETDHESGVDETPVIHPNLRSIFQAPGKVARISKLKNNKNKRFTPKQQSLKERLKMNESFGRFASYSKHCFPSKFVSPVKRQKIQIFSSKEDLLDFFQNSKLMKKIKSDGNCKSEKNSTKNKVANNPATNGDIISPKKTPSKLPGPSKKYSTLSSPTKTPLKSPGEKSLPKTPETAAAPLIKKVPMNKIQVGAAPSPNLKAVRSKVGSLVNTTHKPGGGNIKIESHKIDFSKTQPRIEAKNDQYTRSGGDKKIPQVKLQWSAKSKVGSLENATYKPGGGDKKIESVKLDFKEKAKPKVGSKDNVKHVPGGGTVKIENQKLEFKAQSKVGSLDNVKHRPGGGDIKIFDDKTYLKQISGNSSEGKVSRTQSFGDYSVVREIEGRSTPGTPGKRTYVKIKKTTTVNSSEGKSAIKNVTEVLVSSKTPKKEKKPEKLQSKEQVKLTYTKFSASGDNSVNTPVALVKVPVKNHAPLLKLNLSNKEIFENVTENKNLDNLTNSKQNPESSNLPDGKLPSTNDSGISKFLLDEISAHEKVGEMWKEINQLNYTQNQTSIAASEKIKVEDYNQNIKFQEFTNQKSKTPEQDFKIKQNTYQSSDYPSHPDTVKAVKPQSVHEIPQNQQQHQQFSTAGPPPFFLPKTK